MIPTSMNMKKVTAMTDRLAPNSNLGVLGVGETEFKLTIAMVRAGTEALERMLAADEPPQCTAAEVFFAMSRAKRPPPGE